MDWPGHSGCAEICEAVHEASQVPTDSINALCDGQLRLAFREELPKTA
jgi:hypothetical protein